MGRRESEKTVWEYSTLSDLNDPCDDCSHWANYKFKVKK